MSTPNLTLPLILASVACGVAGQFCLKAGVSRLGVLTAAGSGGLFGLILSVLTNPLILGGLMLYAVGAVLWIVVLSRTDLSYAYPFLALNFVLILAGSVFIFGERMTLPRAGGVALIVAGVLLIAGSQRLAG